MILAGFGAIALELAIVETVTLFSGRRMRAQWWPLRRCDAFIFEISRKFVASESLQPGCR